MIGQFNFPDANIDARDHGGKKPIHMLSHKASERTRSKWGSPCTQPYAQDGQEVYSFLLAIEQRTCVWWKCSWCVCSSPPQFYWQDSTPMVCLWEVEQSSGLTPWLFPLQRAGELLCNFPNCIVLFSLFMTAEVPDHLPSFSQPSKKRSSLERPWSSVGQLYDRRIDSEKVSGFTQ